MMNPMNHMTSHFPGYGDMGGGQTGPGPGSPDPMTYRGHPGSNNPMFPGPMDSQQQQQQQQRSMMGVPGNGMMNGSGIPVMGSMMGMGMQNCGMNHSMGNPSMNHENGMRSCAGCGGKIMERFLLHALDRFWHHGCLKCSCCGACLAELGSSCFTKGGMILCRPDYVRLFGNSGACSACGQGIPANEFVMRVGSGVPGPQPGGGGGVFHVKCFACTKCQTQLMPGDRYAFVGGSLFCEQDCHKMMKNNNNNTSATNNNAANGGVTGNAGGGPVRKGKVGRPRRSRD